MAIELPALPYPPSALEPHISAATVALHHDGHHRAHVEEANRLLEGSGLEGLELDKEKKQLLSEFIAEQNVI